MASSDQRVTSSNHGTGSGGVGYMALMSLGALGVVFGDIGTSPLYAFREAFAGNLNAATDAYGVASLMFWAMILIVTIKYVAVVMRADNDGEGGILALTALITDVSRRTPHTKQGLIALGLFGTALIYGDGIITPAISVLSAVEGLDVATPALSRYVVPISAIIIVGLFSVQRRGTGSIGAVFGPVMIVWFGTLALLGILEIVKVPGVVAALSPHHAVELFTRSPMAAFRSLGSIFLVVTGAEALYADMGHFGRKPIRYAWFSLVLPALTLNYLGQAALISGESAAVESPFFMLAPTWSLIPLVLLATLATVIASQALITGAYSLTMQAVQLGYLPRVQIDHTSPREIGQIYISSINWILMVACVALVFLFRTSSNLAAAYGIAVTMTMVITTLLLHSLMVGRWGWNRLVAGIVTLVFLVVDVAFFSANVLKIAAGGWVPILVGGLIFAVMTTWNAGRRALAERTAGAHLPIERFIGSIAAHPQRRVPGTAVFMVREPGATPPAMLANLRSNEVLHETVAVVSVVIDDVPVVPRVRRASIHSLGEGFYQVVLTYGFMEEIDVPEALSNIVAPDFGFDITDSTFFLGKEIIVVGDGWSRSSWRERLYAVMHRNSSSAAEHFRLPPDQVMEVGTPVALS